MEPTKPKLPSAAIELYNLFIHGEINRRDFMDGVQRFATGGLAVATLLTLVFLPALYVAWFRIKEPTQRELDRVDRSGQLQEISTN